jgi:hypothetical protein
VFWDQQEIRHHHGLAKETNPWSKGVPPRILEEIVMTVSSHWTLGYEVLSPATTTTGLVMISIVEMLASTLMRTIIVYRGKGLGPWILAAARGTAIQVVSLPVYRASECGQR